MPKGKNGWGKRLLATAFGMAAGVLVATGSTVSHAQSMSDDYRNYSPIAAPTDLIRDPRVTPFNIGRRIELADFAPRDAAALAAGLGRSCDVSGVLLERVLHWTGGHPYLTQRMCREVAADTAIVDPSGVDRPASRR